MRQLQIIRPHRLKILSSLPAATLALALLSACSGGAESPATSSGNANGRVTSSNRDTGTVDSAPAASPGSSGAASTTAATATNPYDAAMQKLTRADSYHFIMTMDGKGGDGGGGKPSHMKADGVYAKANSAMQYMLETNNQYALPGEWIDIENGKLVYRKVDGAWTDKGFITPPGVGFHIGTMLTVVTLRNATDPAGNAPPSPLGSENINGQDCDHYRVTLPEQTYDLYVSKASGDVVRAEFTNRDYKQTLSISRINEPVNIAPPI